jgi:hypothetical protein
MEMLLFNLGRAAPARRAGRHITKARDGAAARLLMKKLRKRLWRRRQVG